MRISKIYISAFGGLKDYTLELSDEFNCILGENENGKSTVGAFIKMMFYGSGRANRQLIKSPRQKYAPWSGEAMGGRIYFEHSGQNYCLEREFKKSDNTDKITLRNLDIGTSELGPADIGKRFFGLSAEAFERSVFIGQSGILENSEEASGELNSRLSNLASTGDEDTSYQLVIKRITDSALALRTPRKVGIADKTEAKISELNLRLQAAEISFSKQEQIASRIKQLKTELTETKNSCDETKKLIDRENDQRSAEKLKEYLDTKAALDELLKSAALSDGSAPDELFISKIRFCLSKLSNENTRADEKLSELEALEKSIEIAEQNSEDTSPEHIESLKSKLSKLEQKRDALSERLSNADNTLISAEQNKERAMHSKKAVNPLFLGLGIAAIAIGIAVLITVSIIPALFCIAAGLFLETLAFTLKPQDTAALMKAELELSDARSKKASLEAEHARLSSELNSELSHPTFIFSAVYTD